jgi:hypothetical protein
MPGTGGHLELDCVSVGLGSLAAQEIVSIFTTVGAFEDSKEFEGIWVGEVGLTHPVKF